MMILTLLAMAFAVGSTMLAFMFGDTRTRLFAVVPVTLLVAVYAPPIATRETLQLVVALAAASFGLAAFQRTMRVRRQRMQQQMERHQGAAPDDSPSRDAQEP